MACHLQAQAGAIASIREGELPIPSPTPAKLLRVSGSGDPESRPAQEEEPTVEITDDLVLFVLVVCMQHGARLNQIW